jgi:hypothetical protein
MICTQKNYFYPDKRAFLCLREDASFLVTIYIKRFKKIIKNENIQKMFLLGKSNGFVVLKTFFLNHYVQNCGGKEKVNLGIFPFLGAKYA